MSCYMTGSRPSISSCSAPIRRGSAHFRFGYPGCAGRARSCGGAPRAVGAAAGVAIVVILTLLAGPTGGAPALVIVLLSALIGGFVARQTLAGGADREALAVIRGQGGLKSDKTVLLVDVQDDRAQEVERKLKQAHPEVAVLGTDPAESPPFP